MKKSIITVALFLWMVLLNGSNIVFAKTVNASVSTDTHMYSATANVTSGTTRVKKLITPYYHKKVSGDKRVDETIGLTKSTTIGFSASGDVQLGVDSKTLGLQLLGKAGCGYSVSTTVQKSYTKTIYRNDKTGYYWLEAFCPTAKLNVTAKKYLKRHKMPPKLIKNKTVTLNFAPKLNKIAYRYQYAPQL